MADGKQLARLALASGIGGLISGFQAVRQEHMLRPYAAEAAKRLRNLGTPEAEAEAQLAESQPLAWAERIKQGYGGDALAYFREHQRTALNGRVAALLSGGEPVSFEAAMATLAPITTYDDPTATITMAQKVSEASGFAKPTPSAAEQLLQRYERAVSQYGEGSQLAQMLKRQLEAEQIDTEANIAADQKTIREADPNFVPRAPREGPTAKMREAVAAGLQPGTAEYREFLIGGGPTVTKLDTKQLLDERARFRKESAPFDIVQTMFRQVTELAPRAADRDPVAQDSLIISLEKLRDAQSIVRESEFGRTAQAAGALDRLMLLAESIASGKQKLTPELVQNIVENSDILFGAARTEQEAREQDYRNAVIDFGNDESDVAKVLGRTGKIDRELAGKRAGGSLPPGIPEGSKRLPVMTKSGKRAWQAPDGSLWEED